MSEKTISMGKWVYLNPSRCSRENGKYLASIIDDSVIMCDEIIEKIKTATPNYNEKKQPVKRKNFIFTCIFIIQYRIIDSC